MPVGKVLATATLRLAAVSDTPAPFTPQHLSSDLGAFPAGKPIRFVAADFDGEVAISGLTLRGADGVARVRTLGNGIWSPLAPIDTVGLGDEQVFSTVAAQRLVAEFLAPKPQQVPVPVPTPLPITTFALKATPQPCHVSVAVGDDPPFFSMPGPLPTAPVDVDGLARIAARWLLDHPGASDVPLRIAAAGRGSLLIAAFEATSVPAPVPPPAGNGTGSPAPPPPNPLPAPPTPPETRRALLCDDGRAAAQSFPAGLLAGLALWVRPGPGTVTGRITLHPDAHGTPGEPALPDSLDFTLGEAAARRPQWLVLAPATPVRLSDAWWAVCRVTKGEMLWYRAPAAPNAVAPVVSIDDSAWQAAAPDPTVSGLQAEPTWVRPQS